MKTLFGVFYGGLYLALIIIATSCQHLPGGSSIGIQFQLGGNAPTAKQAKAYREKHDQVLINGTPVDKSKYPSVVRIFVGDSSCTANVIGKRTIITAAHCGETGQTANFTTITGKKFSAKLKRAPGYPGEDLDISIGTTSVDIDVPPMSVRTDRFERKGMDVTMIGYGCVKPGGGGGNDGVLRIGQSKVVAGQGYDLVIANPGGAALCYGDSGGPLFATGDDGKLIQIGVNSKGNIEDQSFCTRLTLPDAAQFLSNFSGICGVDAQCGSGGGGTPPGNDNVLENDKYKVTIEAK